MMYGAGCLVGSHYLPFPSQRASDLQRVSNSLLIAIPRYDMFSRGVRVRLGQASHLLLPGAPGMAGALGRMEIRRC